MAFLVCLSKARVGIKRGSGVVSSPSVFIHTKEVPASPKLHGPGPSTSTSTSTEKARLDHRALPARQLLLSPLPGWHRSSSSRISFVQQQDPRMTESHLQAQSRPQPLGPCGRLTWLSQSLFRLVFNCWRGSPALLPWASTPQGP